MHFRVPSIGRVSGLSEEGLIGHINRNPKLAVPIAPNLDTWWGPEEGRRVNEVSNEDVIWVIVRLNLKPPTYRHRVTYVHNAAVQIEKIARK